MLVARCRSGFLDRRNFFAGSFDTGSYEMLVKGFVDAGSFDPESFYAKRCTVIGIIHVV